MHAFNQHLLVGQRVLGAIQHPPGAPQQGFLVRDIGHPLNVAAHEARGVGVTGATELHAVETAAAHQRVDRVAEFVTDLAVYHLLQVALHNAVGFLQIRQSLRLGHGVFFLVEHALQPAERHRPDQGKNRQCDEQFQQGEALKASHYGLPIKPLRLASGSSSSSAEAG